MRDLFRSPLQREIARCIADGLTNRQIADELGVSLEVVKREILAATEGRSRWRREALAEAHEVATQIQQASPDEGNHPRSPRLIGWLIIATATVTAIAVIAVVAAFGRASATHSQRPLATATVASVAAPAPVEVIDRSSVVRLSPPEERELVSAGDSSGIWLRGACSEQALLTGILLPGASVRVVGVGLADCRGWALVETAAHKPGWIMDRHLAREPATVAPGTPALGGTVWTIYTGWDDDPRLWVPIDIVLMRDGTLLWRSNDEDGTGVWDQRGATLRLAMDGSSVWEGVISQGGMRIEAKRTNSDASVAPTWFGER